MNTFKKIITFALILASFSGFSQKSVSQKITSGNGLLKIHVEMEENGQKQVFVKSYNVDGFSENEKQTLIGRITDSLAGGSNKNMKMKVKIKSDKTIKDNNSRNCQKSDQSEIERNDKAIIDEDIELNNLDFDIKEIQNQFGKLGKTLKLKIEEFEPMMKKLGDQMEPHLRNFEGDLSDLDFKNNNTKTIKSLSAFPNKPNNNKLNLKFVALENTDVIITVSDIYGKQVGFTKIANFTGEYIGQIDLKENTKGTVFVTVVQGEDGASKRVVL